MSRQPWNCCRYWCFLSSTHPCQLSDKGHLITVFKICPFFVLPVDFWAFWWKPRDSILQTVAKWRCIELCAIFSGPLCNNNTGWPKNGTFFVRLNFTTTINRFPKLFHCQNQEKICNNTITEDHITPQVCRYTTLWNVKCLKATIVNKTTSVTTHFKKLTRNNVFVVSVIV